jgi:hypothetical protein
VSLSVGVESIGVALQLRPEFLLEEACRLAGLLQIAGRAEFDEFTSAERILRVSPWTRTPGKRRPGRRTTASLPASVNSSASTRSIESPSQFPSHSTWFRAVRSGPEADAGSTPGQR